MGYAERKAARLNGRPMQSRQGQGDPWYTFPHGGTSGMEGAMIRDAERSRVRALLRDRGILVKGDPCLEDLQAMLSRARAITAGFVP